MRASSFRDLKLGSSRYDGQLLRANLGHHKYECHYQHSVQSRHLQQMRKPQAHVLKDNLLEILASQIISYNVHRSGAS